MISTVTTTTTTTTTVTTTAAASVGASLGLMAVICLIALLIVKELARAAGSELEMSGTTNSGALARALVLGDVLNMAILPLIFVFGVIVLTKIVEVLAR